MGKKKVVIWGIYDKYTNEFLIDDSCKYHPNDLKIMIDLWKKQKYQFFFSSVRDRINNRMAQNVLFDDRQNKVELLKLFKQLYIQELINNGIIPGKNVNIDSSEYINIVDRVSRAGLEGIKSIYFDRKKYESSLNIIFSQLEPEDIEPIKRYIYSGVVNGLTPYQSNVIKHILVYIFLLIFLDIDEYRVVKYIQLLNSKKNKELKRFLKGEFFYEWLLELGKVLRVYKLDIFMNMVSLDILRLVEEKINRDDVGVIGGEAIPINLSETVNNISRIFKSFIETSEFTKLSFVNNLKMCPSLESCEHKKGCELFYHGDIESKYDIS